MKVNWTETAEKHLDAIYSYISLDSPAYAKRMIDRITRRSQQIAKFPSSGRRVPEYDMDQYLVAYYHIGLTYGVQIALIPRGFHELDHA